MLEFAFTGPPVDVSETMPPVQPNATFAELVPIVKIDGRIIGTGKPGAVTNRLVTQYHALTKVSGEPIYD